MADQTRASLLEMGFDADIVERAVQAHPTDVAAAVNFCMDPPPPLQQGPTSGAENWSNNITPFSLPQIGTWSNSNSSSSVAPSQGPPSQPQRSILKAGSPDSDIEMVRPANSAKERREVSVQQPSNLRRPTFTLPDDDDDDDKDLQAALKASMEYSGHLASEQPEKTASWSTRDGARSNSETVQGPATMSGAGPLVMSSPNPPRQRNNTPDNEQDMQRAIHMSLEIDETKSNQAEGGRSENGDLDMLTNDLRVDDNESVKVSTFEDGLSSVDQLRDKTEGAPVVLRTTSTLLSFLPCILQSLYALPSFRQAIITLPLQGHQQLPIGRTTFTYSGYWRGNTRWSYDATNQTERNILIVQALQRLFIFMKHTKRKHVNIQDVVDTLQLSPLSDMLTNPIYYVKTTFETIARACLEVFERVIAENNASRQNTADEDLFSASQLSTTIEVSGKPIAIPFLESGIQHGQGPDVPLDAEIADAVMPLQKTALISLAPDPPRLNDLHSSINSMLGSLVDSSTSNEKIPAYTFLCAPQARNITFCLERIPADPSTQLSEFGQERKPFTFDEFLFLDRYEWNRKYEIVEARKILEQLEAERSFLVGERERLAKHNSHDTVEATTSLMNYLTSTQPKDADHATRLEKLKLKVSNLQTLLNDRLSTITDKLEANEKTSDQVFGSSDWKQSAGYRLSAVMYWSGSGTRENVFTYLRSGENWYKAIGSELYNEQHKQALTDRTGTFMRAGAFLLMYSLSGDAPDTQSTPEALFQAVNADNHSFKEQFINAKEIWQDWNLPDLLPSDAINIGPVDIQETALAGDVAMNGSASDQDARETLLADLPPNPAPVEQPTSSVDVGTVVNTAAMDMDSREPAMAPFQTAVGSDSADQNIVDDATDGDTNTSDGPTSQNATLASENPPERNDDLTRMEIVEDPANTLITKKAWTKSRDEKAARKYKQKEDSHFNEDIRLASSELYKGGAAPQAYYAHENGLGKIGGKPLWLKPDRPLSRAEVACGKCGKTMRFLLHINAPVDSGSPYSAHRALYVFLCLEQACLDVFDSKAVKAYRIQLPLNNPYRLKEANIDPAVRDQNEKDLMHVARQNEQLEREILCVVCGLLGARQCGRCSKAFYCSSECQENDWPDHLHHCNQLERTESKVEDALASNSSASTWAESKLSSIDDATKTSTTEVKFSKIFPYWFKSEKHSQSEEKCIETQEIAVEVLSHHPEQVLRYYDRKGRAIWPGGALPEENQATQIPACPFCQKPRQLEFQIMPRILRHLYTDRSDSDPSKLRFGTIAVYTCSNECRVLQANVKTEDGGSMQTGTRDEFAEEFAVLEPFRTYPY